MQWNDRIYIFYLFFFCLYIVIDHSLPFRKKLFYSVLVKHFFIPCALFFMFSDIREMEKRNPRILSLWWWPSSMFFYCFQTGTFLSINDHFPKQLEKCLSCTIKHMTECFIIKFLFCVREILNILIYDFRLLLVKIFQYYM